MHSKIYHLKKEKEINKNISSEWSLALSSLQQLKHSRFYISIGKEIHEVEYRRYIHNINNIHIIFIYQNISTHNNIEFLRCSIQATNCLLNCKKYSWRKLVFMEDVRHHLAYCFQFQKIQSSVILLRQRRLASLLSNHRKGNY